MPSTRSISANGIELFLREQGQGPLVVLCHGWPELSYSWRHQIAAIADAGFMSWRPTCAAMAGAARLPTSTPTASSIPSATWLGS